MRLPAVVLCLLLAANAHAAFPEKAIKVIVPNGAGGSTDLTTRLVSTPLSEVLGQGIAIVNIPGAGTSIGAQKAARSRADGYTLLSTHEAFLTSSSLNLNRMGPASVRPIAQVAREAVVIAVHPDSALNDLDDYFAAVSKGHANASLKLGVNPGAVSHFTLARTLMAVDADVIFVPTGGGAKSLKSLMGGHIDIASFTVSEFHQVASAGRLRALAVLDGERHPNLPDTPTALEQGHDIRFSVHYVWYAPSATPDAAVTVLADAMRGIMAKPEFIIQLEQRSLTPDFLSGKALEQALDARYEEIRAIATEVKNAGR